LDALETIARLVEKLSWARTYDHRFEAFGASTHRYALREPASEEMVAAFEAEWSVRLPSDYRAFLTHAGNGGAGPAYGLTPLAPWRVIWRKGPRPSDPSKSFVYDEETKNVPHPDAHPFDGCTYLADTGCGYCAFLVVQGSRAGEVWNDGSYDEDEELLLMRRAPSFFEWYEHWLDAVVVGGAVYRIRRVLNRGDWRPDTTMLERVASIAERLHRGDPDNAHTLRWVGYLRLHARDFEDAARWFERALAKSPRFEDARVALFALAWARGEYEALLHDSEAAFADLYAPGARALRGLRARSRARLGQHSASFAEFDAGMKDGDDRSQLELPFAKARTQLELGDEAGAEATLMALIDRRRSVPRYERPHDGAEVVEMFAADLIDEGNRWSDHFSSIAKRLRNAVEALPKRL